MGGIAVRSRRKLGKVGRGPCLSTGSIGVGDCIEGRPREGSYGLVLDEELQLSTADLGAAGGEGPLFASLSLLLDEPSYILGTRPPLSSSFSSSMDNRLRLLELGEWTYSGGVIVPAIPPVGDVADEGVLAEPS